MAKHDTIDDASENFETIEITFSQDYMDEYEGENPRLDLFLADELGDLSRVRIKKLIEQGLITVNNKIEKPSLKLRGHESIVIKIPPLEPVEIKPQDLNLEIAYEDEHLIVVNKPVGMVTHPGAGVSEGTLVNGLLFHCQGSLSGISGEERPGIVHRLDKDTSGLLVVAKHDRAHRHLARQIAEKSARRKYIAIVEGKVEKDKGMVAKPIGRHPKNRKEMAVVEGGRNAITLFEVNTRYHRMTLLDLELKTGRTHQIRVHLAYLGYPVVGDLLYNKKGSGTEKARKKLGLKGHALHATSLSFIHPQSNELLEFSAPAPEEFQKLVKRLAEDTRGR